MEGLANEKKNFERIKDTVLISEVPAIEGSGGVPLTRENLANLVEAPLLEACEELYDKNIQTVMSSANLNNVHAGTDAYIDIDFESLSDHNKIIALQLGEVFEMHRIKPVKCVKLKFPLSKTTTVGEIRRMAHEAVSEFAQQEMKWAEKYTLDELTEILGAPQGSMSPEDFDDRYYDPETGNLYGSKEHYEKEKKSHQ